MWVPLQEHEKQQRTAIAMRFPNGGQQREYFLAKLKDQLEKRLLELKQWHARKKLEEQQYRHGLRQQHPMVNDKSFSCHRQCLMPKTLLLAGTACWQDCF